VPRGGAARSVPLVTLTTDIGWAYAAQMKAVLYRALPPGSVVDLDHSIRPHQVREGAFLLRAMARGFPAGTVHVAVVDPGVGGARAPIAIRCRDGSSLVGPDNGVLALLAQELGTESAVRLDPERVIPGRPPSATFEGRDLFAPAAARLARGVPLSRLGAAHRPAPLELPRPERLADGHRGEVLLVDRFGNLITNVPTTEGPAPGSPCVLRLGGRARKLERVRTYEELARGELGIVGSSFGLLEVAEREGNASERLGAAVGARVEIRRRAQTV
jgi:S-adenosylmethionine hydrolase